MQALASVEKSVQNWLPGHRRGACKPTRVPADLDEVGLLSGCQSARNLTIRREARKSWLAGQLPVVNITN